MVMRRLLSQRGGEARLRVQEILLYTYNRWIPNGSATAAAPCLGNSAAILREAHIQRLKQTSASAIRPGGGGFVGD